MSELISLSNGVRIFADPMPGLESASVGVWFRTGAFDETVEEHGVAHLLEHMAFKGTKTRSARKIAEEIEAIGGFLNASTGYTRTGYYARVLRDDVAAAIEILADIVTSPLLDESELAKERQVVIQEIGEAADTPDDVVMEMLQALNYGDNSLGRGILGAIDSVSRHSKETLAAFMERNYVSGETILAASGAVDPAAVVEQATAYFGERRRSSRSPRAAMPRYAGGAAHDWRKIEQTHIAIAFPGAAVTDDDYFATRVFAEALGGGMSSRIFQAVREERGLAYSVYSFTDSYDGTGAVGAYVGTDADSAAEAVSLIREEIVGLADAPTEKEISRARAMLKSTLLMGLESPSTRAETAVGQLFVHGRLIGASEIAERLDAVSIENVRAVARKALTDGAASLAIVGPADFDTVKASLY